MVEFVPVYLGLFRPKLVGHRIRKTAGQLNNSGLGIGRPYPAKGGKKDALQGAALCIRKQVPKQKTLGEKGIKIKFPALHVWYSVGYFRACSKLHPP